MEIYLTKDELREWLDHPVTKKVQKRILQQVMLEKIVAVEGMGVNQLADRYKAGVLAGIEKTAKFEELFEEEEDNVIKGTGT